MRVHLGLKAAETIVSVCPGAADVQRQQREHEDELQNKAHEDSDTAIQAEAGQRRKRCRGAHQEGQCIRHGGDEDRRAAGLSGERDQVRDRGVLVLRHVSSQLRDEHECVVHAQAQDQKRDVVVQGVRLDAEDAAEARCSGKGQANTRQHHGGHREHAMHHIALPQTCDEVDDDQAVGHTDAANVILDSCAKLVAEGAAEQPCVFQVAGRSIASLRLVHGVFLHHA
mmetsp:Transcript_76486/g.198825  ORF Transcript_76486/g.198825 Transcript_76486/m.198825 type:complete len:226 (-) Transcript_76486:903-1580(-)